MSNEANRIKLPNKNSKTTYVKSQKTVILSSNLLVYQPASKYGYSGIKKNTAQPSWLDCWATGFPSYKHRYI